MKKLGGSARNRGMIMSALISLAAALTIGVLFLILGYVIWNGLFYTVRVESDELDIHSDAVFGLAVIINPSLSLKAMPYSVLKGLFIDGYASWKKTGAGTADVYPYLTAAAAERAAEAFGKLGRLPEIADARRTAALTASNAGGVGLMSLAEYESLDEEARRQVKRLPVRSIRIASSADTAALHGNFRLGSLDESALARISHGEVSSWRELGGGDLPVRVVLPPEEAGFLYDYAGADADRIRSFFASASESSAQKGVPLVVRTQSESAFFEALSRESGAVSFAPAWLIPADAAFLRYAGTESGRNLTLSFLLEKPVDGGKSGGISTIIANTFIMIALTLCFAVPAGVFAAVYLALYAREGRLLRILRLGTETLAGIPSIIFGLFGMLIFVQAFGWGISLISGCLTLALMILPTIVRTAEEAIRAVSPSLAEGSVALGGTKVQTIFRVVLPAAFPAVTAGVILASGRALGETAALIYTMGSNYNLTAGLTDSTRSLAVHLYLIIAEGISSERAFASATVLIVLIFIINSLSKFAVKKIGGR